MPTPTILAYMAFFVSLIAPVVAFAVGSKTAAATRYAAERSSLTQQQLKQTEIEAAAKAAFLIAQTELEKRLMEEIGHLRDIIKSLQADIDTEREKRRLLEDALQQSKSDLTASNSRLTELERQWKEQQTHVTALLNENTALKLSLEELKKAYEELKAANEKLHQEIEALRQQIIGLTGRPPDPINTPTAAG